MAGVFDGSGQDTRFEILKTFASNLIDKYKAERCGYEDMKISIVQSGNGEIPVGGSIANSREIIVPNSCIGKMKKAAEGMKFLKGFTDMAHGRQAFVPLRDL